ncbi:BA14K family protein [Rhizobium sp. WYJ-E13]|uniref:BA14K family protein n=1 Tax=unclassified Rhizobium TaxID=2613769 RepID=UPI001C1E962F|nr:BA14K family protein [Rhizobium sp. WYJ-E13]QWW67403.1 BA14K family protein [Rhizobium sp. WYJ-E13]
MRRLAIIALSIATAFSGMPAWAGPAYTANSIHTAVQRQTTGGQATPLLQIGCNNFTNCPRYNQGWGSNYRYSNRYRYDRRWDRDRRYYGDRHYRDRYYRRHDNTGAIIGGLAAGAIIGGIIASQPRVSAGSSHAEYCYSRYRSYRAYDNTYQPTYGPRRQCR